MDEEGFKHVDSRDAGYGGARPKVKRNEDSSGLSNGYYHENRMNGEVRNTMDSDSGDESIDEHCIYTFKGDVSNSVNVFPDSFYHLDALTHDKDKRLTEHSVDLQENSVPDNNIFSPEMDFLEMDFDPGTGNANDSDMPECNNDSCDDKSLSGSEKSESDLIAEAIAPPVSPSQNDQCALELFSVGSEPQCSGLSKSTPHTPLDKKSKLGSSLVKSWSFHGSGQTAKYPLQCLRTRDDSELGPTDFSNGAENNAMELCGEWLGRRESSFFAHNSENETLITKPINSEKLEINPLISSADDKVMIWSEGEACMRQVQQLAASASGATALVNTLLALNIPCSCDVVLSEVNTRVRDTRAYIPEYLFSSSVEGCTHEELIRAMKKLTREKVAGKFFYIKQAKPCRTKTGFTLSSWLKHWIYAGAVPVLTLNLQKMPGLAPTTDAWHHQMVFGVGPKGVYLTNPLECVSEVTLLPMLSSSCEIEIDRESTLNRKPVEGSLSLSHLASDPLFRKFNVLGQVVNALREERNKAYRISTTPYITIPTPYEGGVMLFAKVNDAVWSKIQEAPVIIK